MRRFCAMLSILLALLFAGVQGANALDRLQHGLLSGATHQHELPSVLTLDSPADHQDMAATAAGLDDHHLDLSDAGEGGDVPVAPHHHHHNADHGSGLPTYGMAQGTVPTLASARLAIPHARADNRSPMTALERPPKTLIVAA